MERNYNDNQCKAKSKRSGVRCKNFAVRGWKVCRMHGARGGDPRIDELNARRAPILRETMKGNYLGLIHGAFGKRLYTDEERQVFENLVDRFQEEYGLEDMASGVLLDELCFRLVKVKCAEAGGSELAMTTHSARISSLMAQLDIRPDKKRKEERQASTFQAVIETILGSVPAAMLPAFGAGHLLNPARTIDVAALPAKEPEAEKAKISDDNTLGDDSPTT